MDTIRSKMFLAVGSTFFLTGAVLFNAYQLKKQFYPSVVYLTKSSSSLAILYIQALILVFLFGKLCRKIFFGSLRAAEIEHLVERSWYAVTETCLAFTVFRDDFSPRFVAMFTVLLFLKVFHWLIEDRVDFMERSPNLSKLFHLRVISLLALLFYVDYSFWMQAYRTTMAQGASVQLVFGFEYAVLMVSAVAVVFRYSLHFYDTTLEQPWEEKAVYMLYCDLVIGLIKVVLFSLFIAIMVRVHTFPLFAIRPMYLSIRFFKKSLNDVLLSRRAINNMNTLYPDATEEELRNGDNTCIICREEMLAGTCKKLSCSHIFHKSCLRSWFQRQQSCPTCRLDVLRATEANTRRQAPAPAAEQPPPPQAPGNPWNAFMQNPNMAAMLGAGIFPPFGVPPAAAPDAPAAPPAGGPPQSDRAPGAAAEAAPAAEAAAQPATNAPTAQAAATQPIGLDAPPTGTLGNDAFSMPFMPPFLPGVNAGAPWSMPPPPANLGGLSEEELRELEAAGRAGLEARVRCLRDISALLDAAVIQMQQYTDLFDMQQSFARETLNSRPPTSAAANARDSSETNRSAGGSGLSTSSAQASTRPASSSIPSSRLSSFDSNKTEVETKVEGAEAAISSVEAEESRVAELRRRRLEKLEKQQE